MNKSEEQLVQDAIVQEAVLKRKNDFATMMEIPACRRYMWHLMDYCKVFHSCFTGDNKTFYREGRRDVGLKVFDDIMSFTPEAFAKMQKESKLIKEES